MRILLLAHSFNSLSQRLLVALTERGHTVSVELDVNDAVTRRGGRPIQPGRHRRAVPEAGDS